jgi:hypothetical protein
MPKPQQLRTQQTPLAQSAFCVHSRKEGQDLSCTQTPAPLESDAQVQSPSGPHAGSLIMWNVPQIPGELQLVG